MLPGFDNHAVRRVLRIFHLAHEVRRGDRRKMNTEIFNLFPANVLVPYWS